MSEKKDKYHIGTINVSEIRNRNEVRVIKMIQKVMSEPPGYQPDELSLQDIYALALNSLPPRYTQAGTIVLRDPVKDEDVLAAVRKAFAIVVQNPKY
ncbi:late competence development ComFB family protein [Desulfovibrio subterraneus]|jgi:hypothetical protein|uniref:Competence protein ComFB n=1 Tax=Desulfovibrio subterraneus TaxID=2718620 RepID=A0A7J0BMV4_9BACT|nr:late competence development ComFB family protein [Desulfovibrio subterraneus]WBF68409.1 late competence development ComFB family protein [Desulfovibrio subterraneus]GFM34364.1 hypothetical protein DSM101010T_27290 [Desulfovibrio subterraneus]